MSKLPATSFSLARYLRQQARTQQRLVQSSAFTSSGISVTADGVSTVDGSLVLPAGSIPDGALANAATREVAYLTATGFAPAAAWTISTFGSDPDWSQIARGDTVRVELDTDVYATERPLTFTTRVLGISVHVPDTGQVAVNYSIAAVQDY